MNNIHSNFKVIITTERLQLLESSYNPEDFSPGLLGLCLILHVPEFRCDTAQAVKYKSRATVVFVYSAANKLMQQTQKTSADRSGKVQPPVNAAGKESGFSQQGTLR